jgi:ABC-type branched-subunit amino acid transport system substrate-binding protein
LKCLERRRNSLKKVLFISLAAVLALSMGLIGCEGEGEAAPDNINILAIRSVTGPLSIFEQTAMGPIYKYWNHVVNNVSGGIYVPEFGEKIPVKIDVFDDNSDLATMQTLMEQKLDTGNYDFVIGPDSTPFLEAAGPICSLYGAVLVGAEGGATALAQEMYNYPFMFSNLSFADWYQVPELCATMQEWADTQGGNITAYVMYLNDQHGYEYSGEFHDVVAASYNTTIIILDEVAMTPFTEDVSAQVDDAYSQGADVLLIFAYPPTPMAVVGYASATGKNFNAIVTGPAACYEGFYSPTATPTGFGDVAIGVSGFGAWNEYSSAALHDFAAGLIAYSGRDLMDWWGGAYYYVGLDMLEQAISTATEYSAQAVRNVLASQKLTTILGETYYTTYNGTWPIGTSGGLLAIAAHPGEVGQWQHVTAANDWLPDDVTGTARTQPAGVNGTEWAIFEVISPDSKATAPWVYPKPDWPT